jgi:hypothetical protein
LSSWFVCTLALQKLVDEIVASRNVLSNAFTTWTSLITWILLSANGTDVANPENDPFGVENPENDPFGVEKNCLKTISNPYYR